jgi:antitoxin ParD1/3/4
MPTSTLNISLPETMRQFVENKIETEGYGTISEYIRELIRSDQRAENSRFETLIAEAYASGKPSPLTKDDINEARRIVKDRIVARNTGK